ncbi:unnamed protein product [Prunus armeniaca]
MFPNAFPQSTLFIFSLQYADFIQNKPRLILRNCNAMKKFSDMGVETKETPLEVAEASDVVITMLPSSSNVYDVYTGPNGLLHGGELRPRLLIDSSTIDPQTSRKLSLAVSNCTLKEKRDYAKKPAMLDAPVSGGVLAAEAGTLTFMVGGSEDAYLAAKSLFLSMGKNTVFCGGPGNGSVSSHVFTAPKILYLQLSENFHATNLLQSI